MPRGHIGTFDGLRVLFMSWVLFYHLPASVMSPAFAHARAHWTWGVSGFLALSGFLLARSLAPAGREERATGGSVWREVRDVVARRTARIIPGYWGMLVAIAVIPLLPSRSLGEELAAARGDLPAFFAFVGNYAIPGALERMPLVLRTYWSLSMQEQFLAFLCLAWVATRARPSRVLLVAALGSAVLRTVVAAGPWRDGNHYDALEGYFHLNVDAMAWGALAWLHYDRLAAWWSTHRRAAASGLAVLAVVAASVTLRSIWGGNLSQALLQGVKYPALALLVAMTCAIDARGGMLAGALRHPALRRVSLASYEIYLVHALVYRVVMFLVPPDGWPFVLAAVVAALLAGVTMHATYSRPAQRWLRARLLGDARARMQAEVAA